MLQRLLLVSIPENILSLYLAFLLTGCSLALPFKDDKRLRPIHIIKVLVFSVVVSSQQILIKLLLLDLFSGIMINMVVMTICLYFLFPESSKGKRGFKIFAKPIEQMFLITILLLTCEALPVMLLLNATGLSMAEVVKDPILPLLMPQIDRVFQIILITMLWNVNIEFTFENPKLKKKVKIFTAGVIFVELVLVCIYVVAFPNIPTALKFLGIVACCVMVTLNVTIPPSVCKLMNWWFINVTKGGKPRNEKEDL
jgi:hypothetical protein